MSSLVSGGRIHKDEDGRIHVGALPLIILSAIVMCIMAFWENASFEAVGELLAV